MNVTFGEELRKWRGKMRQKNACDVIGIPLSTYKSWELGKKKPIELAKEQARWRMAAYESGIPLEAYRDRYLQIIKQVASEILTRKVPIKIL